MKKHTNLYEEIYTTEDTGKDWLAIGIVLLLVISAVIIIGEQTGFTSWLFGTV